MCKPCEDTFKEIEKRLPEIAKLTEELLFVAVDIVCHKITLNIPFIDHVCVKLGDDVVKDIYKFLLSLQHYDPEACCKRIKLC